MSGGNGLAGRENHGLEGRATGEGRASGARRPSLCHDGTPIVYSHELARGVEAPRFRMLVEPGDLTLDVPLQVDCSLHVLTSIGAALGWRIESIAKSILVEALPSGLDATRALWGGVWLGMGATPSPANPSRTTSAIDGSIELRLYANLRHGDASTRWARALAIARVAGVRGGCGILESLRWRIADRAVPVGVGIAFIEGRVPVIRLYVGVEQPSAATLAALTPESHHVSAAPCIACAATVESIAGADGGGFARQGVTIGYDLRTASAASAEPAVARVKYDLSLQTIPGDRRHDVLRAFGSWAEQHQFDGASAAAFINRLARGFGDATCEFISLGARSNGLGATIYARPSAAMTGSDVDPGEDAGSVTRNRHELASNIAIDAIEAEIPRRPVEKSCDAARCFLRRTQSGDGCWREYALDPGTSDAWTTALVGCALLESLSSENDADDPSRRAVARAAHAIGVRGRRGGWGYNGSTACDADSTAWAARLLTASGHSPPGLLMNDRSKTGTHAGARVSAAILDPADLPDPSFMLRRHIDADGGVHTFVGQQFGRWADAHDDVAAVVGCALHESGDHAAARIIVDSLLRRGTWRTFWWTTPAYGWARLLELVELVERGGSFDSIEATATSRSIPSVQADPPVQGRRDPTSVFGACKHSIVHELLKLSEPSSAFDTAQRLTVATILARSPDAGPLRHRASQLAARLAETLIATQLVDGSWRPSRVLRVPSQRERDASPSTSQRCIQGPESWDPESWDPESLDGIVHADGNRIITTAVALAALHRYGLTELEPDSNRARIGLESGSNRLGPESETSARTTRGLAPAAPNRSRQPSAPRQPPFEPAFVL